MTGTDFRPDLDATHEITAAAIAAMAECPDARLRDVMTSLTRHLHDFAREVRLTTPEWLEAMHFLVRAGRMSDDRRNEMILVSDILGIESVVDVLTFAASGGATQSAVLGPFYREGAPDLPQGASIVQGVVSGETTLFRGRVHGPGNAPLPGAIVDVWETAPNGLYEQQDPGQPDMNLRGRFTADSEGAYRFIGLRPVEYPIPYDGPAGDLLKALGRHPYRPGHVHFIVSAPGHKRLVTQIFDRDASYLDSDAVFAVKESLIVTFQPAPEDVAADYVVDYDIALEPAELPGTAS